MKNHYNGARDPYAHFQNEITVDDVLKSPPVCHPLHLLDCCPQTDGAAAAILVNAERAREFTDKPVYVAGFGVATDHPYLHEKDSFTEIKATRLRRAARGTRWPASAPRASTCAEVHDCFTITEILDIEDLGFVAKGDGGRATLDGETMLTGRIPVNTSGGLLAKGHPIGATGVAQLTECWWQLRGDAGDRQVQTRNGFALQHNVGGPRLGRVGRQHPDQPRMTTVRSTQPMAKRGSHEHRRTPHRKDTTASGGSCSTGPRPRTP